MHKMCLEGSQAAKVPGKVVCILGLPIQLVSDCEASLYVFLSYLMLELFTWPLESVSMGKVLLQDQPEPSPS